MPTLLSLMALKVVAVTTSSAISDDKVGIMTTLSIQWSWAPGNDKSGALMEGTNQRKEHNLHNDLSHETLQKYSNQ